MTMIEIRLNGETVQRSKNLRGIITRAHKIGVRFVAVQAIPGGADVDVSFCDDSACRTQFADFGVALNWFGRRGERWGLIEQRNTPTHYSWHVNA
jgi:hypothetical protein